MLSKSQSPPPAVWLKAAVGEERNLKKDLFLMESRCGLACATWKKTEQSMEQTL